MNVWLYRAKTNEFDKEKPTLIQNREKSLNTKKFNLAEDFGNPVLEGTGI